MVKLEDLHTDRTNICFYHYGSWGRGLGSRKASLSPPPSPPLALSFHYWPFQKKAKRKVQGVPQSQPVAFPRHHEKEETGKTKQAQIEQTYEKH